MPHWPACDRRLWLRGDIDLFFTRSCAGGEIYDEREREYFEVYHAVDERLPHLRQLPDSRVVPVTSLLTEAQNRSRQPGQPSRAFATGCLYRKMAGSVPAPESRHGTAADRVRHHSLSGTFPNQLQADMIQCMSA